MAAVLPVSIPIETVAPGTTLARIHRLTLVEPFFGPAPGDPPEQRFHDPGGEFRVCFLGESATASFVETFLRDPKRSQLITLAEIATRGLTTFNVLRELRLTKLRDEGLVRLGCTAEITSSSPPYTDPQRLSRDLWQHADQPDGIQYRCRHDNGLLAVALYDRAQTALSVHHSENLVDDRDRLLQWRDRYGFSLA